jgi:hypothetical protein
MQSDYDVKEIGLKAKEKLNTPRFRINKIFIVSPNTPM